jgi:hypothetical protein
MVKDADFNKLRDRFVAGKANDDEIRSYLKKIGVWARVGYTDGRTEADDKLQE